VKRPLNNVTCLVFFGELFPAKRASSRIAGKKKPVLFKKQGTRQSHHTAKIWIITSAAFAEALP
jgi:hypothetical protein